MAHQINNFIFDIDGTLIDTLDMYMPAMIETLAKYGYPVAPDKVEQTKHDLFGITGVDALRLAGIPEEFDKYFVNQYDFAKLFNVAITSADTKKHKPAPDPILAAVEKMGADPSTTVYVGDTINDLKAAHAAGVKFAGALYGSAKPESIKNADFPLEKPSDLLAI